MMKKIIMLAVLSFLLSCINSDSAAVNTMDDVSIAYGIASAKEASLSGVLNTKAAGMLDFTKPLLRAITDGDNRDFIFVAFGSKTSMNSGYFVVFEMCRGQISEYSHSYAGFSEDLALEVKRFMSAKDNAEADFPQACFYE